MLPCVAIYPDAHCKLRFETHIKARVCINTFQIQLRPILQVGGRRYSASACSNGCNAMYYIAPIMRFIVHIQFELKILGIVWILICCPVCTDSTEP